MSSKPLKIRWSMTNPPVLQWKGVHRWTPGKVTADPEEEALGLPAGTLARLHEAFGAGLSRFTAWTPQEAGDLSVLQAAGDLFRRGVPVLDEGGQPARPVEELEGGYEIGFYDESPAEHLKELCANAFVIIDHNVESHWQLTRQGIRAMVLPLDEISKSLATVANLRQQWQKQGRPPHWVIIGGGIPGDTAGFAAALCQCRFTLVPTTLLAMADACVGGKTGVNFPPWGKNQLGRFAFPAEVRVYSRWLETLSPALLRAGAAECFKHAFLCGDMQLGTQIARALQGGQARDLSPLLHPVINVKAEVVARDPAENGERATLNLGHTLAHALEAVSQQNCPDDHILHGDAVSIGLVFALELSCRVAGLDQGTAAEMIRLLRESSCLLSARELSRRLGVPSLTDPSLWPAVSGHFAQDKKADGGTSRWILLEKPGKCRRDRDGTWTVPVAEEALTAAWQSLLQQLPA